MGVTNTRHGVTSREVLFATGNGQIHAVTRALLDARRPHKPASGLTAEEKEEMLIPYHPFLDENAKEIITYDLEVCFFVRLALVAALLLTCYSLVFVCL